MAELCLVPDPTTCLIPKTERTRLGSPALMSTYLPGRLAGNQGISVLTAICWRPRVVRRATTTMSWTVSGSERDGHRLAISRAAPNQPRSDRG